MIDYQLLDQQKKKSRTHIRSQKLTLRREAANSSAEPAYRVARVARAVVTFINSRVTNNTVPTIYTQASHPAPNKSNHVLNESKRLTKRGFDA